MIHCDLTEDSNPADGAGESADRWAVVRQIGVRRWFAIALVVVGTARFVDVTLAGIVTNDSLGYLRKAHDPFQDGFVSQGYRQVAYPLIVSVSNLVGDVLGWDHIFGVALMQRTLLLFALGLVGWSLRWWSVPMIAIGTSSTYVVHADLLLPEGTLIPTCVIVGGLGAAVAMGRITTPRAARIAVIATCIACCFAASIKLQYAVLLAVAVAAGWTLLRDRLVTKRLAIAAIAASFVFIGLLSTAQAIENKSELGVFEPVSERARAEWYGAWQAVFRLDPDNQTDPALADYFAGGDLYIFLHGIEGQIPDYPERARVIRDRVIDMFEAADTSARREQVSAFFGALGSGRMDDLSSVVSGALDAETDAEARLTYNSVGVGPGGADAVILDVNDGQAPGSMTFGPVLSPAQRLFSDHRGVRERVAWVSIIVMMASLVIPGRHRAIVIATLVVLAGSGAALASGYIDNARYLLGPLSINVIGGTVALYAIATSSGARNLIGRFR